MWDQESPRSWYDRGTARSAMERQLHLAELSKGERALVTGVAQSEAHCQLCGLGVVPGAEVEIVRQLSRKTMLIVRVDGSDVALRHDTASTVTIRRPE